MTEPKGKEIIIISMALNTRVNGSKTNSMVTELKAGLMVQNTKEPTYTGRKKGKDNFSGLMEQLMMGNLKIIISKEMEHMSGLMGENILVNG